MKKDARYEVMVRKQGEDWVTSTVHYTRKEAEDQIAWYRGNRANDRYHLCVRDESGLLFGYSAPKAVPAEPLPVPPPSDPRELADELERLKQA